MKYEDYLIPRFCNYCKKTTKQLVKEISEPKFKEFTKFDYAVWCVICSHGSLVAKDEYKELEYAKVVTTKAGGILWRALQQLNGQIQ